MCLSGRPSLSCAYHTRADGRQIGAVEPVTERVMRMDRSAFDGARGRLFADPRHSGGVEESDEPTRNDPDLPFVADFTVGRSVAPGVDGIESVHLARGRRVDG